MQPHDPNLWNGDYKLPWHDPAFSARMLAEHLSQDHDMASRRTYWIDLQVEWIHESLLQKQPARILDLGCGPGFYVTRLTRRGHHCHGIDIGPASIDYARRHAPDSTHCTFTQGDLRHIPFGGPYDLVMFLFGELNVFSPAEILGILRKARASLTPPGRLVCEIQTPEAVENVGRSPSTEERHEAGLFSPHPHRRNTDNRWLPDQRVTVQTFTITEDGQPGPCVYRSTTQAWPDDELTKLLHSAGFQAVTRSTDWPCNTPALTLWIAFCI